jgi:hypothetical protein
VEALHEQNEGRLILGGRFWMNDYTDTLKLVRVNTNGSLDLSFNNFGDYRMTDLPIGGMGGVTVVTRLDENRFVVGGQFTKVNGEPRSCICCVDTLGNLLDCWAGGGLLPTRITASGFPHMSLQGFEQLANGDWYMFGQYKGFVDQNGEHPDQVLISRMHAPDVGVRAQGIVHEGIQVWPNPGKEHVRVNLPTLFGDADLFMYDAQGRIVITQVVRSGYVTLDTGDLLGGLYLFALRTKNGIYSSATWLKS